MTITITESPGVVVAAAEIDLPRREVCALALDDERRTAVFVGLGVLTGCVEAELLRTRERAEMPDARPAFEERSGA